MGGYAPCSSSPEGKTAALHFPSYLLRLTVLLTISSSFHRWFQLDGRNLEQICSLCSEFSRVFSSLALYPWWRSCLFVLNLTISDVFASILGFLPTGWCILLVSETLHLSNRLLLQALHVWNYSKAFWPAHEWIGKKMVMLERSVRK